MGLLDLLAAVAAVTLGGYVLWRRVTQTRGRPDAPGGRPAGAGERVAGDGLDVERSVR